MDYNIQELCSKFKIEGKFISSTPFGSGHINDTYLINTSATRYILQRVNGTVFAKPEEVMDNIIKVTDHLFNKIYLAGGDVTRETITFLPSVDNKKYYITEQGELFRLYSFINNAKSYQKVESPEIFCKVGKAFGKFQNMLADFPASELKETIVDFHNTRARYETFKSVLKADKVNRRQTVEDEIKFILEREDKAGIIVDAMSDGSVPLRVTHNDTKLNNVLVDDETGEGICVIDLDTVMPGSMLFDYGDSIRFGASTADEDEKDLDKVSMDLELFEQFTKGYIEELKESITPKELELLAFSAMLLTLECGLRFLTDYLDGDNYFRVQYPEQNLDRARTQLKLVSNMEEKMDIMNDIVMKYYNA
ncbi:MAG: aminoglycoside phosphotransferase family protein [Clostridia bacterium]|nr:aminoglycoside phosphotransferase family protein [Clostridia bacterium]